MNESSKIARRDRIYEGKAKIVYATNRSDLYVQYFKDDATAFNGEKRGVIQEKGVWNNGISCLLFQYLSERGVKTHFERKLSPREMLVQRCSIFPIEVVVRNIVAGSLWKRTGKPEGTVLPEPVLEFYYKSDELGDPMLNEDHIRVFGLVSSGELKKIREEALRINGILKPFFKERKILLVDFKLEFGTTMKGELVLADEISPDTCRFWDADTLEKLDKDRFRRDLGKLEETYQEMADRLGVEI